MVKIQETPSKRIVPLFEDDWKKLLQKSKQRLPDLSGASDSVTSYSFEQGAKRRYDILHAKLIQRPAELVSTWGISKEEFDKWNLTDEEIDKFLIKSGDALTIGQERVYIGQGEGKAKGIYRVGKILENLPTTVMGMPSYEQQKQGYIASPLQTGLAFAGMIDPALQVIPAFKLFGTIGKAGETLGQRLTARAIQGGLAPIAGAEWVVGSTLKYGVGIPAKYIGKGISAGTKKLFDTALSTGLDEWVVEQGLLPTNVRSAIGNLLVKDRTWLVDHAANNLLKRTGAVTDATEQMIKDAVADTISDIEVEALTKHTFPGQKPFSLAEVLDDFFKAGEVGGGKPKELVSKTTLKVEPVNIAPKPIITPSEKTSQAFVHYGKVPDLTELDPAFHGTGKPNYGGVVQKKYPGTYAYRPGQIHEVGLGGNYYVGKAKNILTADNPKWDELAIQAKALAKSEGYAEFDQTAVNELFHKVAREAGFDSINYDGGIILLTKQPVTFVPKPMVNEIIASHVETGGSTFNLITGQNMARAKTGYSVAMYPELNVKVPKSALASEDILGYISTNQDVLYKKGNLLGTWNKAGAGSELDVAKRFKDLTASLNAARGTKNKWHYTPGVNQRAIYSFAAKKDIQVPYIEDITEELGKVLDAQRPQWINQAAARTEELAVRAQNYRNLYDQYLAEGFGAEEAAGKAKVALGGNLPTYKSLVEGKLSQADRDYLISYLRTVFKPEVEDFKFINAREALLKIYEGKLLTPSEVVLMEKAFGSEFAKKAMKPATMSEKAWDLTVQIWNLPKNILSSWDISGTFGRQGAIMSVNHPVIATTAFKQMTKTIFSEDNYIDFRRWVLTGRPEEALDLADKAGLYISPTMHLSKGGQAKTAGEPIQQIMTKFGEREEAYPSQLADFVPGLVQSERAYTVYLDSMRAHVWDNTVSEWLAAGKTWKKNAVEFKNLARMIGVFTGRGDLGSLNKLAPYLNIPFFSPRYQVSIVQTPFMLLSRSNAVKAIAARNLGTALLAGATIVGLAAAAGAKVEMDARSTDFGKIKVGDNRISVFGGFQTYAKFLVQEITSQRKSNAGRILPLNRWDNLIKFGRTKGSPSAGLIVNLLAGKDLLGNEISVDNPSSLVSSLLNNIIPLAIQDTADALRQDGMGAEDLTAALGFFGFGFQSYDATTAAVSDMYTTLTTMQPSKTEMNKFADNKDMKGLAKYLSDHKKLPQNAAQLTEWEAARVVLSKASTALGKEDDKIEQIGALSDIPAADRKAALGFLNTKKEHIAINALLMYDYYMQRYDILRGDATEPPVLPTLFTID